LSLARNGPQSVYDLAPTVFGSLTTVRTALAGMCDDGLVSAAERPVGRGRPQKVYRLTPEGRRLFPDNSGLYATVILKLMEQQDPRAIHAALECVREGTVQMIRNITGLPPGQEAIERTLVAAFKDGWGVDGTTDDGVVTATFFHCPVLQLARVFPALCELHRQTMCEVAGVEAVLGEHLLSGGRRCVFTMRFPTDSPPDAE